LGFIVRRVRLTINKPSGTLLQHSCSFILCEDNGYCHIFQVLFLYLNIALLGPSSPPRPLAAPGKGTCLVVYLEHHQGVLELQPHGD